LKLDFWLSTSGEDSQSRAFELSAVLKGLEVNVGADSTV